MNQLTRDEQHITPEEFLILREIITQLSDPEAKASLHDASVLYEDVLKSHGIEPRDDKVYFSALLRLKNTPGETWANKLLTAASRINQDRKEHRIEPTRSHRRHKSNAEVRPSRHDSRSKSVLQQKLDRGDPLSQSEPHVNVAPTLDERRIVSEPIWPALSQGEKYALAERYKLICRLRATRTVQQVMDQWRDVAMVMREYHEEQWDYAVATDHETLKYQAWEIWRHAFQSHMEAHRRRARKATNFVLKKFYRLWVDRIIVRREGQHRAKLAAERQALFEALLHRKQKRLVVTCFRRWRSVLHKWSSISSKAMLLRDKRTQLVAWKCWFFKTCEVKTAAIYDRKLMKRAFHFWLAQLHHFQILDQRIESARAEHILVLAWENWKAAYTGREIHYEMAEEHLHSRLLRKAFGTWRTEYQLSVKQDYVQSIIERRLLNHSFAKWKTRHETCEGISQVTALARLRTLFQSWRRESVVFWVSSAVEQRIGKTALHNWRLKTRERWYYAYRDTQLEDRAFVTWRSAYHSISRRLTDLESVVLERRDRSTMITHLARWRGRVRSLRDLQNWADERYKSMLATSILTISKQRLEKRRAEHKRSVALHGRRLTTKIIHTWRTRLLNKQEHDRQSKLIIYRAEAEQRLAASTFTEWRARNAAFEDARVCADTMRLKRDREQLRHFFSAWSLAHLKIFEMTCVARDLERAYATRTIFTVLDDEYRERVKLNQKADAIWTFKMHAVRREVLHHMWRCHLRYQEKELQLRTCAIVIETRRVRALFRKWRMQTRERNDTPGTTYVEECSTDSVDASRTRVQWNGSLL